MYALHCGRYYISCFFALLYFLFLPLFYILFFFSPSFSYVRFCGMELRSNMRAVVLWTN